MSIEREFITAVLDRLLKAESERLLAVRDQDAKAEQERNNTQSIRDHANLQEKHGRLLWRAAVNLLHEIDAGDKVSSRLTPESDTVKQLRKEIAASEMLFDDIPF